MDLSRNYKENPLKHNEPIPEQDLRLLYLEKGMSCKDIGIIVNRHENNVRKFVKKYNLVRTEEQNKLCNSLVVEKRKNTYLRNFGTDNPMKTKGIQQKVYDTCERKYGIGKPQKLQKFKDKIKCTNLEKYNVQNVMQVDQIKQKLKQTNTNKFGCEYAIQNTEIIDKMRNTNLEKYGCECSLQNKEVKEKSQLTCLSRYNDIVPQKSEIIKERTRQTNLEKYGTEWPIEAINNSKRKNKSFNISKQEDLIYGMLKNRFDKIHRQYMDKNRFPFCCDFYLEDEDLFIDINFHWTHGTQPFNDTNIEHRRKLQNWYNKSTTSKFYQQAIYVWTQLDVNKRQICKDKHVNRLEFYSMEEFLVWYAKY